MRLGVTGEEITLAITNSEDSQPIGKIESQTSSATYTDEQLLNIARLFTKRSGEIHSVSDFYPSSNFEEELVLKNITKIQGKVGPSSDLILLLESTSFLDTQKSTKEIISYLNEKFKRQYRPSDFTSTLDRFSKKGRIKRLDVGEEVKFKKI